VDLRRRVVPTTGEPTPSWPKIRRRAAVANQRFGERHARGIYVSVAVTPPLYRHSLKLAPDDTAPGRARRWIRLVARHLDAIRLQDAVLMVSELVSNSVIHAGLPEDGRITVSAAVTPGGVRVSVCDCGRGFRPPARPTRSAVGGKGLLLVRRLADDVEIDGDRGRVTLEVRGTGGQEGDAR
jgi:anti-sigma regulatory factor (Ser/Thr protein kinase)